MKQRRERMEELINREGSCSFARLKQAFPEVSEMTLRSDLKALDEEKRIVRVYGGARSLGAVVGTDDAFDLRARRNTAEKHLIVRKALTLLRPGMSIFLDSGSTAVLLAEKFPDEPYIVFTSGINCALELAKLRSVRSYLLGGEINPNNLSVTGIRSLEEVGQIHFDLAFLGTPGFSEEAGFTCPVEAETELKRAVIRHTRRTVVLMDSQKVGKVNTFTFAHSEDVHTVITDDKLPQETRELFLRGGAELL